MEVLWKWLMHANARAVLFINFIALLLAAGWLAYQELHPIKPMSRKAPEGKPEEPDARLDLVEYIDRQLGMDPYSVPGSPFRPSAYPRHKFRDKQFVWDLNQLLMKRHGDAGAGARNTGKPKRTRTTQQKAAPKQQDKPKITITFYGKLKRTDGKMCALIHDSMRKRSVFYDEGDSLFGMRIASIESTRAFLTAQDGSSVELRIGRKQAFEQ